MLHCLASNVLVTENAQDSAIHISDTDKTETSHLDIYVRRARGRIDIYW